MAVFLGSGYAEATRRLDAIVRAEAQRTGEAKQLGATIEEQRAAFGAQLDERQAELSTLASELRLPPPGYHLAAAPRPPRFGDDPRSTLDILRRVAECLRTVQVAADEADRLADAPKFLPGWTAQGRNAVIYGGFAAAGMLFQLVMLSLHQLRIVTDQFTWTAWGCCGGPALTFIAAFITIGFVGKPRRSDKPAQRTPRMGALICAAQLPIAFALVLLFGDLFHF